MINPWRMERKTTPCCNGGMDQLYDTVTDLDIEAYVDGETEGLRNRAIAQFLLRSPRKLDDAVRISRMNRQLQAGRARIYQDDPLRQTIFDLLSRLAVAP